MSTSITSWKLSRDSATLAQILTFLGPKIEQTKVVSKALDGSVYIQTIGTGNKYADVTIFATRDEMPDVNEAEADGALVSVVYRDVQYLGYIEEAPDWTEKIAGESYTATFKLLIDEEVSV